MIHTKEMVEPDWKTIPKKFSWFAVDGYDQEAYAYTKKPELAENMREWVTPGEFYSLGKWNLNGISWTESRRKRPDPVKDFVALDESVYERVPVR